MRTACFGEYLSLPTAYSNYNRSNRADKQTALKISGIFYTLPNPYFIQTQEDNRQRVQNSAPAVQAFLLTEICRPLNILLYTLAIRLFLRQMLLRLHFARKSDSLILR